MPLRAYKQATGESCITSERQFWQSVGNVAVLYGSDIDKELLKSTRYPMWNFSTLNCAPLQHIRASEGEISGVHTPYTYFGAAHTAFPWHVEDMKFGALNFLHTGADKHWYCVSPQNYCKMQDALSHYASSTSTECPGFLNHKELIVNPKVLQKQGISVWSVSIYVLIVPNSAII